VADKRGKTPRRTTRAIQRIGLLPAVVWTLLGLAAAGVAAMILFTRLLRGDWPWGRGALDETTSGADVTKVVLTVIAGLGAAVALVVAYRRQRDAELARFDERFAAAAAQLGAPTAAERLAGVYAMAALADTWEKHRQQCIDVLCGYLRLPYDPTNALLTTVVSEHSWPVAGVDKDGRGATGKETRTYEQLPNDREVRLTIISTITRHLRDPSDGGAPTSWQGKNFDFTGATLDGGDFSRATFTGGQVTFDRAQFTGGTVTFYRAAFAGGQVTFDGAKFTDGTVTFDRAAFAGGRVTFVGADFTGGDVTFDEAQFTGGQVTFDGAKFTDGTVTFDWAQFTGGRVTFVGAKFAGGSVTFNNGAQFTGGHVSFDWARLRGGSVAFFGARFSGGRVTFDRAKFAGGEVTFDHAEFAGGEVTFDHAEFAGGEVTFDHAEFAGGEVTFDHAEFAGGVVTRDGAEFRGWPDPDPDPEPPEDDAG
jgi:uncharacterized protein YjbI with pentapeptide repeats